MAAVGVLLAALGCSGVTEMITGVGIEELEDGSLVITDPDGKRLVVQQGSEASLPEGFPMPLPPGDEKLQSTLIEDGGPGMLLTYELQGETDTDELIRYYEAWFEKNGLSVERKDENMAGMRTTVLRATGPDRAQMFTLTEAFGSRTLIIGIE